MAEDQPKPAAKLSFNWDTQTAIALIVLAALLFLWLVDRGFRGFTVGGG